MVGSKFNAVGIRTARVNGKLHELVSVTSTTYSLPGVNPVKLACPLVTRIPLAPGKRTPLYSTV